MAGLVSKTITIAACALFGYYVLRIAAVSLALFYPTTHIPIIKPVKPVPANKLIHELAWQEPFDYETSMYVTTERDFISNQRFFNSSKLVWKAGAQSISQRYTRLEEHLTIDLPERLLLENGTDLYAFLFVQKAGQLNQYPNINDPYTTYARAQLVSVRLRQINKKHALLGDKGQVSANQAAKATTTATTTKEAENGFEEGVWVPHAKTRLSWEIVLEDNRFSEWSFPYDLAPHLKVIKHKVRGKQPYVPLLWENPLSARKKHWTALTTQSVISKDIPLEEASIKVDVSFSGITLGWFRLCNYAYYGLSELSSPRAMVQYSEADIDNLKEMVYEVNPTMLAITVAAMALHMLFEFLAYKEDVSFWSSKSEANLQGISRSSMLMSVASSWISCLYMWDRKQETNVVVLLGATVGAFVEAWKFTKVVRFVDLVPFRDKLHSEKRSRDRKPELSVRESVQREVDKQTAWYMIHVCIPAMFAYAAFSLVYQQHESYISWFLNISLVTVYSLEFIQMWPQLLINHKLKTVDMLPLTAFLYRFLTTFIDDLYALVVPMPLIERIGTLRDDIVFFVLCYQWYKFPRRKNDNGSITSSVDSFVAKAGTSNTNKSSGMTKTKSKNSNKKDN